MNPPDEKIENVAPDEKIENVELTEQIEKSEFSERIENMALTERRARKPFTQSTEKVPKPEHLRSARTCACEPYQKAYVRTCAHVTEAHPFVHSAPCAAAPVRTPPVARDRWRDVGRGRHQEVCRWAQSSFAARPPRSQMRRASHHGAPGGSRGPSFTRKTCDRRAPEDFPGLSVQYSYWAHQACHSSRKARAPRRSRRNRLAGTPPGSRRSSSSSSSSHSVLSGTRCGSGGAPDHQYPKE